MVGMSVGETGLSFVGLGGPDGISLGLRLGDLDGPDGAAVVVG